MKNRLYSLCGKIVNPIAENLAFFIISSTLLILPAIIRNCSDFRYWIMALPICVAWAFFLSHILYAIKSKILKIFIYTILTIICLVEIFIIDTFGTRFSALIVRLVMETNPEEASGFFSQYVIPHIPDTIIGVVFLICFILLGECFVKPSNHLYKTPFVCVSLSIIFSVLSLVSIGRDIRTLSFVLKYDNIATIYQQRIDSKYGGVYTSYGLLLDAINCYFITCKDIDELAETLKQPIRGSVTYKSRHVCLIIGESFNKYHASIYGYPLNTTPALCQELTDERLFVFGDVVTPVNATIEAMQLFSSFSNKDNNIKWSKTPLLPILYKNHNYFCSFISNSEVSSSEDSVWDTKNNYWVSKKTAPLMFNAQNTERHKYDEGLLFDLKRINPLSNDLSFTIIHLLGQHSDYKDRYPETNSEFGPLDYWDRNLNKKQKLAVSEYDNATLYNDYVIGRIIEYYKNSDAIVVYFSDHGEEVYDYRDFVGRSHEPIITPERAKYQFEVPFMVWMSDKYKESHPDVVAQVERSVDRPYMIDDLPHLMLDIAGIECEWFDPTRSVINDKFNAKRKRLLLDSKQDYDEIMRGAK